MTPPAAAMPTVDAGRCFPAELLEQLKEQLPQVLFATLSDRVATYEEQFGAASQQLDTTSKQLDTTRSELQYARLKIQVLEEHLRLRRIAKYGPGSEKLSNLQLQLLEEEPGSRTRKFRRRAIAGGCRHRRARRSGSGARIPAGRSFPPICRAWRRSSLARPSSACAESAARKRK